VAVAAVWLRSRTASVPASCMSILTTGREIGRRLVDLAKELRPDGLGVWTFQSNRGAIRFYERQGFTALEYTDGANEEGAPGVRYQWLPDGASACKRGAGPRAGLRRDSPPSPGR
jgi:hypothetical protein